MMYVTVVRSLFALELESLDGQPSNLPANAQQIPLPISKSIVVDETGDLPNVYNIVVHTYLCQVLLRTTNDALGNRQTV